MSSPTIRALLVLFLSLKQEERNRLLSTLMDCRFSPQVKAMPDPFSIISDHMTDDQVENVVRGMMATLVKSLPSVTGDLLNEGDGEREYKVLLAPPELMAAAFVRTHLGGQVPADIIGSLNMPAHPATGNYVNQPSSEGDYPMEGGLLGKIKSGLKVVTSLAKTPIGSKILGAAKFIPGLGTVASVVDKGLALADKILPNDLSITGIKGKAADLVSKGSGVAKSLAKATAAQAKDVKQLATKKVKDVLANPEDILPTLISTFGEKAVSDAILNIIAQEGDLYDDVTSGQVKVSPITLELEGDTGNVKEPSWSDKLLAILQDGAEGIENATAKVKDSGAKAYDKLAPKVSAAWESPWGKAAAGATAVSSAALLYYGVSKAMANSKSEKQAKELLAKKKAEADALAAAERRKKLALGNQPVPTAPSFPTAPPLFSGNSTLPSFPPPRLGPVLPPSGTSIGLTPGTLPGETEVSEKFIKIPFMGVSVAELYERGQSLLNDWMKSLMKVNPLLSGDIPEESLQGDAFMDYFGSNFLLHGFPLESVRVIYARDLPVLEAELAQGHSLASPALTRSILSAAIDLTGHRSLVDSYMVKDRRGNWRLVKDNKAFSHPAPSTVKMPRLHPRNASNQIKVGSPSIAAASKTAVLGDLLTGDY